MAKASPTKTLRVDGGTIAYDDLGTGPPIVLLHEAIADRHMWDRELPELAKRFRTVRYDLRGYGGSAPATAEYSSVRDLKALVDHLALDRPVVVGPSMGGAIAVDFAVEYPGTASGLFLIAPGPPSGTKLEMLGDIHAELETDERVSKEIGEAWKAGDVDLAVEKVRELWGAALQGKELERFREMVRRNAPEALGDRSAQHDTRGKPPAVPRLSSITMPVEIVVGDRDAPLQLPFAMFIAQRVPGARLQVLPGADHLPNFTQPAAFDRAFGSFLDRVFAGR